MKTSTEISFGLVDVSAKQDVTATCADKQPFVDMGDFSVEGVAPPPAGTCEKNYVRLDGSFVTFPNSPELTSWGLWSNQLSGENGIFENPIVLDLSFAELHSSIGVSFEFNPYGPDWCNDLNIKWYKDDSLLYNLDFQPDRWNYSAMQKVENFNHIIVTFRSMTKPSRYLKLQNVIYGITKYFENGELTKGQVEEETDLSGTSLPYNTLSFSVYSQDKEFDIFNPQGVYTLLQKKQQLSVTGFLDSRRVFYGIFYVDEISQNKDTTLTISAGDALSIMDSTYYFGNLYENTPVKTVLDELFDSAGFAYTLDSSFVDKTITGWIPYGTHRDSLTLVCLAIGATASTARTGTVVIRPLPTEPDFNILFDRKITGNTVKYREYVSGVDVTSYSYTQNHTDGKSDVYKGDLVIGDNTITFSNPVEVDSISISAGTLKEKGVNYCIITSDTEQETTVSAYEYAEGQKVYSYKSPEIIAGEKENIKEINSCTLVNDKNALEVAKRVYDYYQMRIEQSFSIIPSEGLERPGVAIGVEVGYNQIRPAVIESSTTDIYGGHISKLKVVGS